MKSYQVLLQNNKSLIMMKSQSFHSRFTRRISWGFSLFRTLWMWSFHGASLLLLCEKSQETIEYVNFIPPSIQYTTHVKKKINKIIIIIICDIDDQNNKGAFPSKGTEGCIFEPKFLSSIKVFNNLQFNLEEWICFKEGHYWYDQLKMKHASSTTHSCCPK